MAYGYSGRIVRVNLSNGKISSEEQEESFYRLYFGGKNIILHYLLRELGPGVDPLGPDNKLIFATSVVTGTPLAGTGRNSMGAKSPLTGAYGEGEGGGYVGAELKRAGIDAIIVEGKAEKPVYLWVHDGEIEIRDAQHLWGKATGEAQELIRQELGDNLTRTAQIGPGGEKLVRFAAVANDINHFIGRTGIGAVMGSKNLKAFAVRGRQAVSLADPDQVQALAKWMATDNRDAWKDTWEFGTTGGTLAQSVGGGLPTRNFHEGVFEEAENLDGQVINKTILVDRGTCWACPIHCKRHVKVDEPYQVDPIYGGPEYESIGALASCTCVGDLKAVAKANELCSSYGLDTISAGVVVAFAMECFENGLITKKDTDGLELTFGNGLAMVQMVEKIGKREGIGDLLAEGVMRAAEKIGRGAERFAMHAKGQEIPMHEPRQKQGLAMGYAVSPTGADHGEGFHDTGYAKEGPGMAGLRRLGIYQPLPTNDLSPAKVRMFVYMSPWRSFSDCIDLCIFVPWGEQRVIQLINAVTGWNTSQFELLKAGERSITMARAFIVRQGKTPADDWLPERLYTEPHTKGPYAGVVIDKKAMAGAIANYYTQMGWDEKGIPTKGKLDELGIGWVAPLMDEVRSSALR